VRVVAWHTVNVGIHRVSALVELGKVAPPSRPPRRFPRPGWRCSGASAGLITWWTWPAATRIGVKSENALTTLLEAERFAPAEVRCRPMATATITDLLRSSKPAPLTTLQQLADRTGVAA
jgi:hypothetical protein